VVQVALAELLYPLFSVAALLLVPGIFPELFPEPLVAVA